MTDRLTVDQITSDQLDHLYDERDRVRELTDRWVKAGPPPLGTPIARWWDRRLAELHAAVRPTTDQTTEQPMPQCTATIEGPHVLDGGPVQCTREAGHPENHVGPEQNGNGRTLWTDHNAGATPHGTASKEQH
jgi:hypothetical protein